MSRFAFVFTVIALVASQAQAQAQTITSTLGEQDFFVDGDVDFDEFNDSSIGEDSPFDGFNGSDIRVGENFDASFIHTFATLASVDSATITLGLYDHDSAFTGSQLANFSIDGNDLTTELNDLLESNGGDQGEFNIYTLALPTTVFGDLLDGSATLSLTLQGETFFQPGNDFSNGGGLDFATLSINTAAVPEPSALIVLSLAMGIVGTSRRRR